MEVVSHAASVESAMGWENIWMLNQASLEFEAYAKSSWAKIKLGTAVEPVMVTSLRKIASGVGLVMAGGGESCAAMRSNIRRRRKRIFISRTSKFNMKRNGGQQWHVIARPKGLKQSPG